MSLQRADRHALRSLLRNLVGSDLEASPAEVRACAHRLSGPAWAALPAALDSHGITLQAAPTLRDPHVGAPAGVLGEVNLRARAHTGGQLRTRVALERLVPLLDTHCDRWALLKGPVLADHAYRVPGRRSFSDLDVLVAPQAVRDVLAALLSDGAELVSRNWQYLASQGKGELVMRLPNGTALDLHWGLLASPDKARELRFSTPDLLSRTRQVQLRNGLTAPSLSPADLLIHVAVHGVLSGFAPLRLALDVDQLLRHDAPDAAELLERSRTTRSALLVAVALQRTASVLGPAMATDALVAERGAGWVRLMRIVDRLNPPTRSHEPVPVQFITASTRVTTTGSLATVGDFALDRLRAVRSAGELRHRLRHGIQTLEIPPAELLEVDGGHREALLRRLDAS